MRNGKAVLVFGTFDGLHNGHRFFLREARRLGQRLIASVAQDSTVQSTKKHPPARILKERLRVLEKSGLVDQAVPGDMKLGNWSTVHTIKPDIIALGYDQKRLEEALRAYIRAKNLNIQIVKIVPLEPNRLHSSLLRTQ